VVFPYEYLFRTVNTHLLIADPLRGEAGGDRRTILEALAHVASWVAYDLPGSTRGFRFWAEAGKAQASLGGEIALAAGQCVLRAELPRRARIEVQRAGQGLVFAGEGQEMQQPVQEPGPYRLQAWIRFRGKERGWIFSNPIYVRP